MTPKYVDLHLLPDLNADHQIERMINKASNLGYQKIAIPTPPNFPSRKTEHIKDLCIQGGLDFVSRLDLKPRKTRELIHNLRRWRRRYEIISVACYSKSVARQAAKDRRVDLIRFPFPNPRRRFFDRAEAELASHALTSLEIDLKPLLILKGRKRIRLLSTLRREVSIAEKFEVPLILSSAAHQEILMRKPRAMAALTSLFDLSPQYALQAINENPLEIIERNRKKLGPQYIAPGIRLIRRGKDCPQN